jgi:hypothetical protein
MRAATRLNIAIILVIWLVTTSVAQPPPQQMAPREIVNELTRWSGDFEPAELQMRGRRGQLLEHVAAEPGPYVPLVREILHLPERLDASYWKDPALGERWRQSIFVLQPTGILYRLGRQHAEPILLENFVVSRRHFEQTLRDHAEADRVYRARRAEDQAGAEEELAEVRRLNHVLAVFSGRMTRLIDVAGELRSPVLVDQVLDFYESGLNDCQGGWARYPLLFAPQREDVIPRLKAIMESPRTDRMVIHQIKQALEWYARTLAQQDQGEGPLAAGAVPPAGAAAVPPDARPR